MAEHSRKVALVTGASSGFGKLIAETLIRDGLTVYGTSRRDRPDTASGVKMRVMDVTNESSITACVDGVLAEAGHIDVLVNNAGITHSSFVEETHMAIARSVFETNFFGLAAVTSAVLPHMRAQRSGKIINIASLAGLIGAPGQGYYTATKHAVVGYSKALYHEVAQFGVQVVVLEPGFFKTEIHNNVAGEHNAIADYDATRAGMMQVLDEGIEQGADPQDVADVVSQVVKANNPRLHYRVGTDAFWLPIVNRLLPQGLYNIGLRWRFKL
ncbi:MAG: SDR family NAD(P)-dependent oxidoreductase [Chloroflexota bacterium]